MAASSAEQGRWDGHPAQARALRLGVLVAPLVTSVAVVVGLSRLAGPLPPGARGVLRLLGFMVLAMVVAAATERLAKRLLPLSVLLELSMLFPERAPSRLAVARRAKQVSPHDLLDSADEDAASAAVRILALMSALAAHDRRTRGHAERVRAFTDLLSVQMDLPRADRDRLRWAALLHDVGKLGVAPSLLNKPSRLDPAEWETIRGHPAEGQRLAGPLLPWLGEWGKAIVEHHERFDGTGYPMGLAAAGISRAGRMVGVVDAYETMTAARAYKKAFATREARAELARCAGSQFDPAVVRAFLAISLPRLLWATGPLSFLVQVPFLRFIQEAGARVASVSSAVAATTTAVAGAAVLTLPVAAGVVGPSTVLRPSLSVASAAASVRVGTLPPSNWSAAPRHGTKPTPRTPRAVREPATATSDAKPVSARRPRPKPGQVVSPRQAAVPRAAADDRVGVAMARPDQGNATAAAAPAGIAAPNEAARKSPNVAPASKDPASAEPSPALSTPPKDKRPAVPPPVTPPARVALPPEPTLARPPEPAAPTTPPAPRPVASPPAIAGVPTVSAPATPAIPDVTSLPSPAAENSGNGINNQDVVSGGEKKR